MGRNGYTANGEKLEVFAGSGWVTVTGDIDWAVSSLGPIRENQSLINDLFKAYFKPQKTNGEQFNPTKTNKDTIDFEKIKFEMFNAPSGKKIERLWNGDTRMHKGDHSAADLALCGYLVQYTKGDYQTVDKMFRQSSLYRKKWDEKRGNTTYGSLTINKALENSEFYSVNSQSLSMSFERDVNFEVDVFNSAINDVLQQNMGDIVGTETNTISIIEEKIALILEKINSQSEFNQYVMKQLDRNQTEGFKRFANDGLEIQNTICEYMNEIQKQLQQISSYLVKVNYNNRPSNNYKLLFGRVVEITERQGRLEEFNKKLLSRIDEQEEYITRNLEQNNLKVTALLSEILEVKSEYTEILIKQQMELKTIKNGFFSRFFNR